MADGKLVQILEAPKGLFALVHGDDGGQREKPVLCLGLTDSGVIKYYYLEDGRALETWEIYWR